MTNQLIYIDGELYHADDFSEEELVHYGVKGMKWGKRKSKADRLKARSEKYAGTRRGQKAAREYQHHTDIDFLKNNRKSYFKNRLDDNQKQEYIDRYKRANAYEARKQARKRIQRTAVGVGVYTAFKTGIAQELIATGLNYAVAKSTGTKMPTGNKKSTGNNKYTSSSRYIDEAGRYIFAKPNFGGNVRLVTDL